jgi:transcriptional regulator with XRE-family HTH domain
LHRVIPRLKATPAVGSRGLSTVFESLYNNKRYIPRPIEEAGTTVDKKGVMTRTSKLEAAREAMNLSVRRVAETLELDVSGYSRIEQGRQQPKQETAREIFKFFGGVVPLGMVYDPTHPTYDDWLTRKQRSALAARGLELVAKYPELGDGDRRKRA